MAISQDRIDQSYRNSLKEISHPLQAALRRELDEANSIFLTQCNLALFEDSSSVEKRLGPHTFFSDQAPEQAIIFIDNFTIGQISRDQNAGGVILAAILAHEVAHAFQALEIKKQADAEFLNESEFFLSSDREGTIIDALSEIDMRNVRLPESVRAVELHADFMAGWYLARRGFSPQVVQNVAQWFFASGDLVFQSAQHHGRPEYRMMFFSSGYGFRYGAEERMRRLGLTADDDNKSYENRYAATTAAHSMIMRIFEYGTMRLR